MIPWIYNGEPITIPPEGIFGFVYNIKCNLNGRQYIGKKQFWSNRSKKVPGKKNRKHIVSESDWKEYWSSSEDVKADIEKFGQENFTREIIRMCPMKRDLTFGEVEIQIKLDVLTALLPDGTRKFYNKNILSRWFVQPNFKSEETRQKMSEAAIKLWKNPAHKEKQHQKSQSKETKKKHSLAIHKLYKDPEYCKKMSKALKGHVGVIHTEETKKNIGKKNSDHWKDPVAKEKRIETFIKIRNTPEYKEKQSKIQKVVQAEDWKIIYPNGEEKQIKNLNQFCRDNDLQSSNMIRVSQGKQDYHKGFRCFKVLLK